MKRDNGLTSRRAGLSLVVAALLAMGALSPPQALAQLPARFYWKTLSDANAVPLIYQSMSGNTNPFDPSHTVTAGANFDAAFKPRMEGPQGVQVMPDGLAYVLLRVRCDARMTREAAAVRCAEAVTKDGRPCLFVCMAWPYRTRRGAARERAGVSSEQ